MSKKVVSVLQKLLNSSPGDAEKLLALLALMPVSEADNEVVSLFVTIFVKSILMGKQRPTPHVLVSFYFFYFLLVLVVFAFYISVYHDKGLCYCVTFTCRISCFLFFQLLLCFCRRMGHPRRGWGRLKCVDLRCATCSTRLFLTSLTFSFLLAL